MTRHLPEQTRREQILAAARKCFIERGYHPTRMEDIAAAAALSKGGVYFHFESKREVFDTLVLEEFDRSMTFIRQVVEDESPIAEKMAVLGRHYVEYFQAARDAPRFFIVMGEMGLRDETLKARLLGMQAAFIQEIERLVQRGIEDGVLRPVDAGAVGALLKALIDGIEGLHALEYPIEFERLVGVGLELVLGGLIQR